MEEDRYLVFYLYSLKYKQMNGQSYLTRQWHCPSKVAKSSIRSFLLHAFIVLDLLMKFVLSGRKFEF